MTIGLIYFVALGFLGSSVLFSWAYRRGFKAAIKFTLRQLIRDGVVTMEALTKYTNRSLASLMKKSEGPGA